MDITSLTVVELGKKIKAKEISCQFCVLYIDILAKQ